LAAPNWGDAAFLLRFLTPQRRVCCATSYETCSEGETALAFV
jgi:hypothetical protein